MGFTFTNLLELEDMARAKVPRPSFDYIAGGAEDEVSLRRNREAYEKWALRPRVLVDVTQRDPSTTVLGQRISMPVLVAPTAFHGLVHPAGLDGMPESERGSAFAKYVAELLDPSVTWRDIAWLRSLTSLPLVLKGIMTAEDATLAVENGANGIVVSNHGGRQLDSTLGTLDALPEIVDAAHGRAEVYMDGGIRRGTDVLKALALGAKAVLVGRSPLWGLALGGAEGVRAVLEHLRNEFTLAMALTGRSNVAQIDRGLVQRV